MVEPRIVDAHVHFWDPAALEYPWLRGNSELDRPWLPTDYAAAHDDVPIERCIFIEANARPDQNLDEVSLIERYARADDRIGATVAFVDLTDAASRDASLARLTEIPRVRGIRHNIQGQPPGFCLHTEFVEGVRAVGRHELAFDLCVTHDQLYDVVELVRRCPDTRFVLDHCGKPAIRSGLLDPWRSYIDRLAACDSVCCKISGLFTEADPAQRSDGSLLPYVEHVVERFGTDRVMYGSDWPVVSLAGSAAGWYAFTRGLTRAWSPDERSRFYRVNALGFYRVPASTPAVGRLDG